MNGNTWKTRLLATSVFAGAAIAMAGYSVAQDAAEDDDAVQQTITVTGSRIQRLDFVSNSPISTVDSEQFELTGTVNTESLLNTLPQTIPGFDRTSNNPGNGTATVDLRGLGANRTLVLVNGRRFVPSGGDGVVDLNNIPPALIERVEVVTGGASAVYGADAVAGVVNFILKDDFEGVQVDAGYEATQDGDAEIFSTAFTVGGNFDDGRGNAVLSLSYADRKELFQGDRDFSNTALFDAADSDGDGRPDGLEPGGSSGVPDTSIFAGGFSDFSESAGIIFNQDGSVRPFIAGGDPNDFYNYAPVNYIQLPQERFTATGLASYEINENFEAYTQFSFANNRVPQQLAPTPIFESSTFSLDGNPFITPEAQQIISDGIGDGVDTDGDGIDDTASALLRRRLEETGPRINTDTFNNFQFTTGLRGDISENIAYDVYFQEGRVEASFSQAGNVSRNSFNQGLLLADADGDGNVDLDASGTPTCADTSGGCVPINLYGQGNISPEAAQFLQIRTNADADYIQTLFVATLSGDTDGLVSLPGGAIGWAGGVEYREESFDFRPSQALATGEIAGFNGQPAQSGGFDVYEAYAEVYLPILADVQFADILAMELAFRTGEYSTVGQVETYKIAGEWAPIEDVRFRGSFNTAVRAPNIGELFAPSGEGFPGAADPCAANGGAVGTADEARVRGICEAQGVPTGTVFSPAINPAAGQVRGLFGGNPELDVEEADTYTVGVVYSPSFVDDLTITFDYFDIEIDGAIASFGGGVNNILDNCFNNTETGGLGSLFCDVIQRRPDGTIDFVAVQSQNAATQTKKGFDLTGEYTYDAGDLGIFAFNYVGTLTTEDEFLAFEGADIIDCNGSFGVTCGEPIPEYVHRATARYARGPITGQLAWRYVGEVNDDDDETVFFVETIDAVNYFDASASYDVTDNLTLTFGIDNLLDEEPPVIGGNDEQANTYPATYDVFGRTFFGRVSATF